jgi:type II secretory pathway predicted ATPase ExeA
MIDYDLELNCSPPNKSNVLITLNELLLQNARNGRTTVLIVDEAQNLSWELLEEIRLLGNLENRAGKLLQIILAGQPEFDRVLDDRNCRQLKQRITLRCTLQPFEDADTANYINTRLEKAGMPNQKVIPAEVIAEVHLRSQGIPRVINAISDNLLLTAFALTEKTVTTDMLDEVCEDMRLDWPGRRVRREAVYEEDAFPHKALSRRRQ